MNNEPVAWMLNGIIHECDPSDWAKEQYPDQDVIPLYTHPVKELHLSLQKDKETGELLAVTYTDDEHRIVEVLWKKPPVKELTDEEMKNLIQEYWGDVHIVDPDGYLHEIAFIRAILRKAQEK